MTETGFEKADSRNLPNVQTVSIVEYLVTNENHNIAEIRGAKMLMSSRESYLNAAVGYVQIRRTAGECVVKARVVPEHKVSSKPYTVVCTVDELNNNIKDSTCADCAAAAGGCKHSLLLLFWLANKSAEPASTEVECYWNKPSLTAARTEHVASKDIFPKAKKPRLVPKDPAVLLKFYEECEKRQMKNSLILDFNPLTQKKLGMNIFDLMLEFVNKSAVHSYENFKKYLNEVICQDEIDTINKKTEGQVDNKYWHTVRQGRLTASKLHEAAQCKTEGSLVEQILGGYKVPETNAIQRGRSLEQRVIKEVENKLKITINKSGFMLINGILGASPDGICEDYIIEIKCPASEKAVQTYIKNNTIQKKFKAQVQCQMLACKKSKGLFCVAAPDFETTKNVTMVWENFDESYIKNIITKAEHFWEIYIFPKLLKSAKY